MVWLIYILRCNICALEIHACLTSNCLNLLYSCANIHHLLAHLATFVSCFLLQIWYMSSVVCTWFKIRKRVPNVYNHRVPEGITYVTLCQYILHADVTSRLYVWIWQCGGLSCIQLNCSSGSIMLQWTLMKFWIRVAISKPDPEISVVFLRIPDTS